ncbi:MAG: hypothetical protein QMC67_02875 [Candidatus Wallbacteria bacterium]
MTVDDFFREVSSTFKSHADNILPLLLFMFFVACVWFYFAYLRPEPKPEEKKKGAGLKSLSSSRPPMPEVDRYKIINNIISDDASDDIKTLKEIIISYIDHYCESPLEPIFINFLNAQYWNLIYAIIKNRFSNGNDKEMKFTNAEKYCIDFGYISDKLVESQWQLGDATLKSALEVTVTIQGLDLTYLTFSDWLLEELKKFIGLKNIETINAIQKKTSEEIENNNKLKKESRDCINNVLNFIVNSNAVNKTTVEKIVDLTKKISSLNDVYSLIKYKMQAGSHLTKEEMAEYVNIENFLLNNFRNERRTHLAKLPNGEKIAHELRFHEERMVKTECAILHLVALKGQYKAELDEIIRTKREVSKDEKIKFLISKVDYIKNLLCSIAQANELEPILFLTRRPIGNTTYQITKVIAKVLEADSTIFSNRRAKNLGIPQFIFVPGCGNGIYQKDINSFIIPVFPLKDFSESIMTALVMYRLDVDEYDSLKNSYSILPAYKRLSKNALVQTLIKDYISYITHKSLDREVFKWFKNNIIPQKSQNVKTIEVSKASKPETEIEMERKINEIVKGALEVIEEVSKGHDDFMKDAARNFPDEEIIKSEENHYVPASCKTQPPEVNNVSRDEKVKLDQLALNNQNVQNFDKLIKPAAEKENPVTPPAGVIKPETVTGVDNVNVNSALTGSEVRVGLNAGAVNGAAVELKEQAAAVKNVQDQPEIKTADIGKTQDAVSAVAASGQPADTPAAKPAAELEKTQLTASVPDKAGIVPVNENQPAQPLKTPEAKPVRPVEEIKASLMAVMAKMAETEAKNGDAAKINENKLEDFLKKIKDHPELLEMFGDIFKKK